MLHNLTAFQENSSQRLQAQQQVLLMFLIVTLSMPDTGISV